MLKVKIKQACVHASMEPVGWLGMIQKHDDLESCRVVCYFAIRP